MILRRRPAEEPTPAALSPDRERLRAARTLIERHTDDHAISAALERVDAALVESADDRDRIEQALEDLGGLRVTAELKTALRARLDVTAPDTAHILSLRRRHEAIHTLLGRRDDLDRHVEATIADVESLVAETVTASVTSDRTELDRLVQQLTADAAALTAAHEEVARIGEGAS